jgi:hypothetical protein
LNSAGNSGAGKAYWDRGNLMFLEPARHWRMVYMKRTTARRLGADEDTARFEEKLRKIAEATP